MVMQNIKQQDPQSLASYPVQYLTFGEVCSLYRKSRSGLYKLIAADATFPKPIKEGAARSARSYFVASEIASHQETKLAARGAL